MNPKKAGKILAVVMVSLLAYGFASSVNLMVSDSLSLEIPEIVAADDGQISVIGDPDFEPVNLNQRIIIINVTNDTQNQTNITRNISNRSEDNTLIVND